MRYCIEIVPKTLWAVVSLAFLLAAAWLVVTRASSDILIVYLAIVFGEGIRPAVRWLQDRRLPRWLAILVILALSAGMICGLLWLVLTPLIAQLASLIDHSPAVIHRAEQTTKYYEGFLPDNAAAQQLVASLPGRLATFAEGQASLLIALPLAGAQLIFNALFVVLITIFWLLAGADLARFTLSFVPASHRAHGRSILDDLSAKTGGYLRGVLINMAVIGVVSGIGDYFLAVPYALLLGVVAGLTESIPVIGPFLGGAAAVFVALVAIGWQKTLWVALMYVVIQQFEGNTLVPLVMNRAVDLTPFTIVIALLIGAAIAGVPGAVLSLPAAAVIKVLIVRIAAPALRRETGAGSASDGLIHSTPNATPVVAIGES